MYRNSSSSKKLKENEINQLFWIANQYFAMMFSDIYGHQCLQYSDFDAPKENPIIINSNLILQKDIGAAIDMQMNAGNDKNMIIVAKHSCNNENQKFLSQMDLLPLKGILQDKITKLIDGNKFSIADICNKKNLSAKKLPGNYVFKDTEYMLDFLKNAHDFTEHTKIYNQNFLSYMAFFSKKTMCKIFYDLPNFCGIV